MKYFYRFVGWLIVAFFAGWAGIALWFFALIFSGDDEFWDITEEETL